MSIHNNNNFLQHDNNHNNKNSYFNEYIISFDNKSNKGLL